MGIKPLLDAAERRSAEAAKKMRKLTDAVSAENRTELTEDEARKFEKLATEIREADAAAEGFREQLAREERATAAAATSHEIVVDDNAAGHVRSPMTYEKHSRSSYFLDLGLLAAGSKDFSYRDQAEGAAQRLAQHRKEVEVEAKRDSKLADRLNEMRKTPASLEARTNPNTTYGTGGEFVPPLWLVSQYVPFVRPGRVFADRIGARPLPAGIDVINLPKITVGTLTGIQANQGGAVASQDIQTSTVSAKVNTIAGQEDISLQLLEQSPISMDGVIYDDLSRSYDQQLDLQVIAGTGLNGQHLGVLSVAGSNAITVASATFFDGSTSGTQYRSLVNGVNAIETSRFANPTAIWAHPRRANSWSYAADGNARPLYTPAKYGQYNQVGTNEGGPMFQGVAGELYGLPVVKDANMPTTLNGFTGGLINLTGGTADSVVVLNEDDLLLWEGTMRMRALPEILSGTLQIRYQLYAYSAFMPNRFAQSISVLGGNTGMAAPSF